jgi:hypothetical protein
VAAYTKVNLLILVGSMKRGDVADDDVDELEPIKVVKPCDSNSAY